ncbi:MAG: preprotein translocase subunit SecG [Pseudomonadota bacterium]
MLTAVVLIVHIIVCIALILIILLQTGKGADIGAVFGGGSSQTVFGSTGAATFPSKVTIAAAVVFMVTSIVLTYFSGRVTVVKDRSIMGEQTAPIGAPVIPGPEGAAAPTSEQNAPASAPAATPSAE